MPVAHASSSHVSDTASTEAERSASYTLALAAGVVTLAAVIGGFVLVALSITDVVDLPLGWGAGLCLAGWAAASARRDRASQG